MSDLKSYTCPNCGANTTNTRNCEYCGSLLVRFVEKGIDLSGTSYTNNDNVFPVILSELRKNLDLQIANPKIPVATDISKIIRDFDGNARKEALCILSFSHLLKVADRNTLDQHNMPEIGFIVTLDYSTYADTNVAFYQVYNAIVDERLARFMQLDSFPLFEATYITKKDSSGQLMNGRFFTIGFGQDIEGTARLISEILIKVHGWSLTDSFYISTNAGDDNIERDRQEWMNAQIEGMNAQIEEMNNNSGCAVALIAIISSVSFIMNELFSLI